MLELITPNAVILWDEHMVQVYFAENGTLRALHLAHIQDAKLTKDLFGGSHKLNVVGTQGYNLLVALPDAYLAEAETLLAAINGAVTRRKAGKG